MAKYYFVGIKGSGMSSLAVILFDLGNEIIGYDDFASYKYTEDALIKRNIKIYYNQDYNLSDEIVVYTPAVNDTHPELIRAKKLGLKCLIYNQMLGVLTTKFNTTAICGCHGKTTTTAMLAHVLNSVKGYETNYLIGDGDGYANPSVNNFVIEACEFKRHFLDYYPKTLIMTNIEYDHVDYYKDLDDVKDAYTTFANQTTDYVVACGDDENIKDIKKNIATPMYFYGFNDNNDFIIKNAILNKDGSVFDVYYKDVSLGTFDLPLYGKHMVLNAVAVIAITYLKKIDINQVKDAIKTFKGAKKRFTEKIFGNIITVDDYAHHHTELKVTIESARQKYPNKEIVAIYLPNTYSRTKLFYKEEAAVLNTADKAYVMDIKADRERSEDYPGISSDLILNNLNNGEKISLDTVSKLLVHKNSVMIFMSCTNIFLLQDKYESLLNNIENL